MGLLDALLPPDHSDVAMAIRKYAVSTNLSDLERSALNLLRVGEDVFIREKVLFMCAFIRACLLVRENNGDRSTGAVRHYFDIYAEEYFKSLPGVAASVGVEEYQEAKRRYGSFNRDLMYPGFLERVKQDPAERDPVKAFDKAWVNPQDFDTFVAMMDYHGKSAIDFLGKQLARIKS